MQEGKQFLLEAVGLLLLVALLLTGVRMFRRAESAMQVLERQQEKRLQELQEYEAVRYDGCEINGITAVSYIRSMVDTYGVSVTVATEEATFLVAEAWECEKLRQLGSGYYIDPTTRFRCEVLRDENDALAGARLSYVEGAN